jgi:hypothetical protein
MRSYHRFFSSAISRHFPVKARAIVLNTDSYYFTLLPDISFAKHSPNPIDKRLDVSAYFLALMKTLHEQGESFETIRRICLEIAADYVRPKNPWQKFLKRLPRRLVNTWLAGVILKSLGKRALTKGNPEGFVANIITDKNETYGLGYGIDILECGICKLYKKHGYEKYASILCEVDKITSSLAGLKLIRTGTIALGASKCDFRFVRQ